MIRDVFYFGAKPNVHPREKYAKSLTEARERCITDHFWVINEFCDYSNFDWDFDFEFLPDEDVWAEEHNNVWPSQHQKDSGTWLCPNRNSDVIVYRSDVDVARRKNIKNECWVELDTVDPLKFDFSWHPDPTDPPYIYTWGCKFFPVQLKAVLEYRVPGATQHKYMDTPVELLSADYWVGADHIDCSSFDLTWRPDPRDPPFIYAWGNQWNKAEDKIAIQYAVPGATEYKYMSEVVLCTANMTNWVIPENIDQLSFDFSWEPNPHDQPYIYQFGTQHQKTGGPRYVIPDATEVKYIEFPKAVRLSSMTNWTIPNNINISEFDFSWHPDDTAPPYVYQFPTEWALTGGPIYTVPGGISIKHEDCQIAKVLPSKEHWEYDATKIDVAQFDFSWHPYADDQPYIYQFGTQHQKTGGPRYLSPGTTDSSPIKYIDTRIIKAIRLPDKSVWDIPDNIGTFDYSWHPDDTNEPYIYIFGTQHQKTGGPTYIVPDATENFYVTAPVATRLPSRDNWKIPTGAQVDTFDFSWHPDDLSPPYIYQFGTIADPNDGPIYVTPNTNGEIVQLERIEVIEAKEIVYPKYYITSTLEDLIALHTEEIFWALNSDLDYSDFDFSWCPNIAQAQYVHAFGTRDNLNTQTYFVNGLQWAKGNKEINYVEDIMVDIKINIDMFYVDRGNSESSERFEQLKEAFGSRIQKTRYLNSWVDTINRCTNRASTNLFWVLNSELDYTGFDFDYYPNPWQMKMVHVFGTQWSHWGTTFMVNKETFSQDTKYIKIIEHLSNLNFVKTNRAKATTCIHDIVVIDHGNKELDLVVSQLKQQAPDQNITKIKYNDSYLKTLTDIVTTLPEKKDHYLWVCSSICDYSTFDFSYVCDPFAKDQLHVFPSNKQKFGDTFFIDVNKTRKIINDIAVLDDYDKVNFNNTLNTTRLPEPIIITTDDTHVNSIRLVIDFPYATIINKDNIGIDTVEINEPMCLWVTENKNIIITSTGASRIIVPKEAKDYVKKELYDYPYIKKSVKLAMSVPMDIVYLSNGEMGAEENWKHLLNTTRGLKNRVVRVDGVNGRVAAYHAALEASNTPWAFTVFAKLKVSPKFDFNFQPDRMQIAKHYIFHAKNPVNGLVYGHQAAILYNKKLVLANSGKGLDFTLDDEHEVVPLISGTANYNTDPFSTWRTAFREALKLRQEDSDISNERLAVWLNKASGEFAQYSIKGAVDACEYYDEVLGNFDKLKLSYDWQWLASKFEQV